MNAPSTVAPRAHAIDPKMFLDYFTECGGGYCLTPDRQLWLGILQTGTTKGDRTIAAQIMREIKPADAERIKDYLISRENGTSGTADNWSSALARFRIAERAYRDCVATNGDESEEADQLCDALADAELDLMKTPAPDSAALAMKLEKLLEVEKDGYTASWSSTLANPALADVRRLLTGDDSALVAAWQEARELTKALNGPENVLPGEDEMQERLDRLEQFIVSTPATTTAGVMAKLQLAVLHGLDDRADNNAMTAGDYKHLAKASKGWDFNQIAAFSALQSLRAMEG